MFSSGREEVLMGAMSIKAEMVMIEKCGDSAWNDVLSRIQALGGLTVAYSGGIDSRFLVHAAIHACVPVELVHVCGPHVAPAETGFALDWAFSQGLEVRTLRLDPLLLPEVAAGGRERCYVCKRHLFEQIMSLAGGRVCDGSNVSDAAQYRPGRRALQEMGVLSPLAEAGLTKDNIRSLSKTLGLPTWNKPALACLASRIPYFSPVTPEKLRQIDAAESFIRSLGSIVQVRVRHFGDTARIELDMNGITRMMAPSIREQVISFLKQLGFVHVLLDLEGYRMGNLNPIR